MKRRVKGNELPAPCRVARKLHSGFDGFRAGIPEETFPGFAAGHQRFELAGKLRHLLVIKVGTGHVDQRFRLLLYRPDDVRVTMPGGADGNAGVEVEESI